MTKLFKCISQSKQECYTIVSTILAASGLIAVNFKEIPLWQRIVIGIALACALIIVVYSIIRIFYGKHIYKPEIEENEITNYMNNLYKRSGSVLICTTGRLKWMTSEIKKELDSKAENKNLIIYSATKSAEINDLEKKGAIVFDTQTLGVKPGSNSSIINANANDIFIAVGYSDNKFHIIDEYDSKSSLTNTVNDLVRIVDYLSKQNKVLKNKIETIRIQNGNKFNK